MVRTKILSYFALPIWGGVKKEPQPRHTFPYLSKNHYNFCFIFPLLLKDKPLSLHRQKDKTIEVLRRCFFLLSSDNNNEAKPKEMVKY